MKASQEINDRVGLAIRLIRTVEENADHLRLSSKLISLIKEAELKHKTENCVICNLQGINNRSKIEEHHISGRQNYKDTISVCIDCHQQLSELQLKWLESTRHKLSAYLLGWSDLFYFVWIKTHNKFFKILSKKFTYQAFSHQTLAQTVLSKCK